MLPDWVDPEAWAEFVAMRKKIKRPLTDYAMKLAIKKLAELKEEGYDPKEVLEQSIMCCWLGLFPTKQPKNRSSLDTAEAWLIFRQAIRDQKQPADPKIKEAVTKLGGLNRLGEMTSFDIERKRPEFDAAIRG